MNGIEIADPDDFQAHKILSIAQFLACKAGLSQADFVPNAWLGIFYHCN
jgi:hypothetical protein